MKTIYQIMGAVILFLVVTGLLIWWPVQAKPLKQQPGEDKASGKVSLELVALQEEYEVYQQSGNREPFQPSNSLVRVSGDLVVIDAVAASDANVLRADLETLGLQNGSSFGQLVSGQLPIASIEELATLDSLQFVRPAFAATGGGTVPGAGGATTGSGAAIDPGLVGTPGEKETIATQNESTTESSHRCIYR